MTEDNGDEGLVIDFGDECDLHHFHPRDRDTVVKEFIRQAWSKGLRRLRIVHGKGRSVAKARLVILLGNDPRVERFADDGVNWGATVVFLKNREDNENTFQVNKRQGDKNEV